MSTRDNKVEEMAEEQLLSDIVQRIYREVVVNGNLGAVAGAHLKESLVVIIGLFREKESEFEMDPTELDRSVRKNVAELVGYYVPLHMKLQGLSDVSIADVTAKVRYALEQWRKKH